MTTATDVNSVTFRSAPRTNDENNSSFLLNESIASMDVDTDDLIHPSTTTIVHGHLSPLHPIENGRNDSQEKRDVFRLGNPILNKSFDVLPQVKDNDTPSADLESSHKATHVLDTTVELPNQAEEPANQGNSWKPMNNNRTPTNPPEMLAPQFSLEYPFDLTKRADVTQPVSPSAVDAVAALTKQMKLNMNKTRDGQESTTPILSNEKSFDANTFVLKKKERRKLPTPANESSLNSTSEMTPPSPSPKQSPFNTPSVSLEANVASRLVSTTPSSSTDPSRIIDCVEQYYRILFRVCECTEELKQELRQVKNERDQMSEDLINAENAFTDVKKRNEKLKLIINEHKANTETLKRFSEESVRYTEEQKQKYAVLKQHAQEKLSEANGEIERLRRGHGSDMEGVQTQLRYAQLRVQSLEQEMKSIKQELEQKKRENNELTNICDELLATNKK